MIWLAFTAMVAAFVFSTAAFTTDGFKRPVLCSWNFHRQPKRSKTVFICTRCMTIINRERLP